MFGLGNVGLLEFTVGNDGVSSRIGMGGTNISINNIISSIKGAKAWNTSEKINKYTEGKDLSKEEKKALANALRMQYGFGDEKQLKNLDDILSDKANLGGTDTDGKAQTVADADGTRTIMMAMQEGMDWKELGLMIGHEAYRDGVVREEQTQRDETREAVKGHTEMAEKMLGDVLYASSMAQLIDNNQNLQMDLLARALGEDFFNAYIDGTYDSSADYWKLTYAGRLKYDGSGWLRDEDGKIIQDENGNSIGDNGVQTGFEKILKLDDSIEAVKLMRQMGLEYTKDKDGNIKWYEKDSALVANGYDLPFDSDTRYQALNIYTQAVRDSMYNTGNLDDVVQILSFPKGSYEYSSPVYQYLSGLLDTTIERNNAIKNTDVSKYEKEVTERIEVARDKGITYGAAAKYDENKIPSIDSKSMVCTEFASYASQKELNVNVAYFIDNLSLYDFDEVSPDIVRSTDLIAIKAYTLNSAGEKEYNNHIVEYLGNNKIAESAGNDIGVRYSTTDRLLEFYNTNGYKYEISYYRPRSYRK